ncbi:hypothetical protein [Miltoncostaea oceani]|uniref:hypothetical protein n=1 Tax=Miltoncostaea oceani TaxID=2843216 RepID=UPI001C3DD074|nr:hypothetical protein [Miltoncostaea oceani]
MTTATDTADRVRSAAAAAGRAKAAELAAFQSTPGFVEWKENQLHDLADTTERRGGHETRYLEAEPYPDEPRWVRRYVVIQPDGTRRPRNGRVLGEGRGPTPFPVTGVPQVGLDVEPGDETGALFPRGPLGRG